MSALPQPVESQTTGYQETPSMILPAALPWEISSAIDAAAQRVDALAEMDRELNFVVGDDGELTVEVRDLDGNVLKAISPTQAMGVMSGFGRL